MSNVPDDLKYTDSHEWLRLEQDGAITVGITDYAQESLGDLVFVEMPQVGRRLKAGEACAVVESVKAASDTYAPVAGEVVDTNSRLAEEPELINRSPYDEGWLMRIQPDDANALESLLDPEDYENVLADAR
ncbi:glycine cleavage system protein GcvH [Nitrococcus mobilis]|uniref:Glycine cleavage system H protein n=1 Tax=Nitrococcus mobilis Nb-231 TaxID=314278 RepID=A4BS97_9GAMM|nr:glycine cleavage system protein GcvH [Nitrococcus mobilis]EAR21357.1 glycine cleavage system protein H [Nitrococcus mobilis Nb-231]